MDGNLLNNYFQWLLSIIDLRERNVNDYISLLSYLHSIEFRWLIITDKNRAIEGLNLRDLWTNGNIDALYELNSYLPSPCSVLEMLVAMSIKCEYDIMHDPDMGDRTPIWFWLMIQNLGLNNFQNDVFDLDIVSNIVWIWMDRQYNSDGSGGLFPLRRPTEDCRNVEIWGLLNRWISENYEQ